MDGSLKFYNTLSRQIEEFKPINPPYAGYYSCGPTVYDYAHIGHGRTYIFADLLERVLEFNGYKVVRVMNITDVGHLTSDSDSGEDKMEKGAAREKRSVWDLAEFYTNDFYEMLSRLNIRKPKTITRATDFVGQMIALVSKLEDRGFTYLTTDGVYFNTKKLPDYGKLTGKSFSELESSIKAGARVEIIPGKKNITDFALWKLTTPGVTRQMEWDSPWGRGFPGWHIECSAMGIDKLGESFDIHTGGVDHIQIHHTNEIAQSEAATGKPFVRYWLHAGHLTVDGAKMSKSLNNFYRVTDVIKKGFNPLSLRYLFLQASYRKEMNFTWESMQAAENSFRELTDKIAEIKNSAGESERNMLSNEKLSKTDEFRQNFISAVNNDLNTASGVSVMWTVVKSNIPPGDKLDLLYLFDEVLGLKLKEIGAKQEVSVPPEILTLARERDKARQDRNFVRADEIRKRIEKEGYIVEDSPGGTTVKSS